MSSHTRNVVCLSVVKRLIVCLDNFSTVSVCPETQKIENHCLRLIFQSELEKNCSCKECSFEYQPTTSINSHPANSVACRFAHTAQFLQQREATWLELSHNIVCELALNDLWVATHFYFFLSPHQNNYCPIFSAFMWK